MNMALGNGMFSPMGKRKGGSGVGAAAAAVELPPLPPASLPSLASKHVPGE
jgi:hypothetical protein